MRSKSFYIVFFIAMLHGYVYAGDIFAGKREAWLRKADELKPRLIKEVCYPVAIVQSVKDTAAFQGWRMEYSCVPDSLYGQSFKAVKSVTLDFGRHITGYFTLRMKLLNKVQDAPIRLLLTFGEVPSELNTPFDPWKGKLSRAWMQDEVITVSDISKPVTLPRRVSFRYVRISLLAKSGFDFALDSVSCTSTTSAGRLKNKIESSVSPLIKSIHDVAVCTLKECMQTVYEDGPKRDRRLWVGDLYLESLVNTYTFSNHDLTKRCLYLFAGLSTDDGIVVSNCFEHPVPHAQEGSYLLPYCLLYNSTLLEYVKTTGDYDTGQDLWPVAVRQIEDVLEYLDADYTVDHTKKKTWVFFEGGKGLDVQAPMHAAAIFAITQTCELAGLLQKGDERNVKQWGKLVGKMRTAAYKKWFDKRRGIFVSGRNAQVSEHTQAWMVIAGVVKDKKAQGVLRKMETLPQVFTIRSPYAMHYVIEAMIKCGLEKEARAKLEWYWGGMVKKGADTFWEAYNPADDYESPYNFFPLNSYCHAWSSTPAYFINKYPQIFQK